MTEFNLTENFIAWRCSIENDTWKCGNHYRYTKKDGDKLEETLKEFIQRLKKLSKKGWEGYKGLIHIDDVIKLAGKQLIDNSPNSEIVSKDEASSRDTPEDNSKIEHPMKTSSGTCICGHELHWHFEDENPKGKCHHWSESNVGVLDCKCKKFEVRK